MPPNADSEGQPDVMGAYLDAGWTVDADGRWHAPTADLGSLMLGALRGNDGEPGGTQRLDGLTCQLLGVIGNDPTPPVHGECVYGLVNVSIGHRPKIAPNDRSQP